MSATSDVELALGVAEGAALRLQRLRAGDVAGLAQRADLARQGLHPVAHLIALGDRRSRSCRSSSMARSMSPRSTDRRGERGFDSVRISAQAADVDHGA